MISNCVLSPESARGATYWGEAANLFNVLFVALSAGWSPWGASRVPEGVVVLERVLSSPRHHHLHKTRQWFSPTINFEAASTNESFFNRPTFFLEEFCSLSSSSVFSFSLSFGEPWSWSWSPLSSSFRLDLMENTGGKTNTFVSCADHTSIRAYLHLAKAALQQILPSWES